MYINIYVYIGCVRCYGVALLLRREAMPINSQASCACVCVSVCMCAGVG